MLMMVLDVTKEFLPVLIGMNVLFGISAVAVFGPPVFESLLRTYRHRARPQLVTQRPALAR